MKRYQMIVQVEAELCDRVVDDFAVGGTCATQTGYSLRTPSGFCFWLPREVFERCFVEFGGPMKEAIEQAVKQLAADPAKALRELTGKQG